jgi:hypothetical protein
LNISNMKIFKETKKNQKTEIKKWHQD